MLKDTIAVLRIRIIVPMEVRLTMLQERMNLTGNDALNYIQKMDEGRRKWVRYLYGVEWDDPALYDLVLNLEHMDIEEACEVINALARTRRCFQASAECQGELDDLAIASSVRAALVMNPSTSHLEVETSAKNGQVFVRGKVTDTGELDEVNRIAMGVQGVTGLNLDELIPASHV
jgi:hypothetical protein